MTEFLIKALHIKQKKPFGVAEELVTPSGYF
jgi:hypothetical protein